MFWRSIGHSKIRGFWIIGRTAEVAGLIEIDPELCKDCRLCISVCPQGLIDTSDQMNQKGYCAARFIEKEQKGEKKCTGCALCAIFCPEMAIEVYRG